MFNALFMLPYMQIVLKKEIDANDSDWFTCQRDGEKEIKLK